MRYREVERELEEMVASASHAGRASVARWAVERLTTLDGLERAIDEDFDAAASAAFRDALRRALSMDADALTSSLERIDAGDLSGGDLDTVALWSLTGLEAWRDFQRGDESSATYTLAVTILTVVDFELDGARLDDFLADPRMRDQYATIARLLEAPAE